MNCNDGKCNKIREGILHEESICLKSNIKHKEFYIFVITISIVILLFDITMYNFTDYNLDVYHKCIANTIRENGTINTSQFTACSTNDSQRSQFLIAFILMNVIAFCFICQNIALRRKLNSIDDKLNKK